MTMWHQMTNYFTWRPLRMNKDTSNWTESSVDLLASIKNSDLALITLIRDRLGIIIHRHQTAELHKTVVAACKKFHCLPEEYLQMLSTCPDQSPLLEHLVAGITVSETYFFRDKNQITFLQERLLPNLVNEKRNQNNLSLRIWSAGCASGEEIFTIVMLIHEIIRDINDWTLNILGTDINTASMQKAMAGHYGEWSMRSIPEYFKQRYFIKENNQYTITKKICDLVKFDYLNLNDDNYPAIFNGTNAQDLILCRNVLIYFDTNSITKIMKKLSDSLIPGGYLMLGASDPIDFKSTNLIFHHDQGLVFSRPTVEQLELHPVSIPENKITPPMATKIKHHIEKIQGIEKHKPHPYSTKPPPIVDEARIAKLIDDSKWQEIVDVIHLHESQIKKSAFLLNAKATALANLGNLEEAIKLFQDSLALDWTNKFSYFTYALTLAELNHLQEAEYALRKTIYLDHQFVEAHYQLGLLLLRNKQQSAGLKCLKNALTIAKSKNPTLNTPGPIMITYGRLVEILGYEIELYSALGKNHYAYKDSNKQKA